MRIVIGCDHAGFPLKASLVAVLRRGGHEVLDVGAYDDTPSDYPDAAAAVAEAVLDGRVERGVLLCGSGVGASIAASKFPGVRAATCHDVYSAAQGVEHDDMNVLVLGARVIGSGPAEVLLKAFLGARFSGEPRHVRRLEKVTAIEGRFTQRS